MRQISDKGNSTCGRVFLLLVGIGSLGTVFYQLFTQPTLPSTTNRIEISADTVIEGKTQFCPYNYSEGGFTPSRCGQWKTLITSPNSPTHGSNMLMQAIHINLLPSGKVLIVNGGSNRWTDPGLNELWPYKKEDSLTQTVLFSASNATERLWENQKRYYDAVNNNGILDPETNDFFRIGHPANDRPNPLNSSLFIPNDLFCAGMLHLRDGNLMVNGGTEYYGNARAGGFTGAKSSYIYDWKKSELINWNEVDWTQMVGRVGGQGEDLHNSTNPWIFAGDMRHGRWYSEMVELMDGRLVVFGGHAEYALTSQDTLLNPDLDFFDYDVFLQNPNNPNLAWTSVALPEEPTRKGRQIIPYPHIYQLPDKRIMVTGGGGGRADPYLVTVVGTKANPNVTIVPDTPSERTMGLYSSSVRDPNNPNRVLNFGGFLGPAPSIPGWVEVQEAAPRNSPFQSQSGETGRGSRHVDVYTFPTTATGDGIWQHFDNFMGPNYNYDRGNHMAILLPTKEIFISGGGYYQAYGGVKAPVLASPVYLNGAFTGRYTRRFMAPMRMPRLYHQNALLLPDGRVLAAGGNSGNALLKFDEPVSKETKVPGKQPLPNEDRVRRRGIVNQKEDLTVLAIDGECPAEIWTAEVFSPPYIFIDGSRQARITAWHWAEEPAGVLAVQQFNNKNYYLVWSEQEYFLTLEGLPSTCTVAGGKSGLVLMKLGAATHAWDAGQRLVELEMNAHAADEVAFVAPIADDLTLPPAFYMLFYIDCRGKPSQSLMVRFDNEARSPLGGANQPAPPQPKTDL